MEEDKSFRSSAEQVNPSTAYLRQRRVPDVPEDVDLLDEHFNDPNYDLKSALNRGSDMELAQKNHKLAYSQSEIDVDSHYESDRYSTSRAESRNSTSIEFDDESPYPEVRAAVSSVDDPLMPVNTFRMWVLGVFFSLLVSALNQMLGMRYPSVYITGIVIQLVSLPFGRGMEYILPTRQFKTFGCTWSFNPGPFNIKEHVCITVMANVAVIGAFTTDITATQQIFYDQSFSYGYQVLLALGTQIIGFSLAGFLRQWVVWPSSMIWPSALVSSALFNTLHKNYVNRERGHISRQNFFLLVFVGSFVWYWVPGYLFTALSVFNWVCWIVPDNVKVNALFGTNTGLGMGLFTFDWSMIAYVNSPLVTPWWSQLNTIVALVVAFWVIVPCWYFTNTFYTAFLPISSAMSFDNTGAAYDPSAIITNAIFDLTKYRAYSPVYVSATLLMAYAVAFALFPAVIVHTILWYRRDIASRMRRSLKDERDVHSRLMQVYPEAPLWWYAVMGVICFVFLVVSCEIFATQVPVWGICIALLLAAFWSLPVAMIRAVTNQDIGLFVIHEMMAGYMFPGRPVANMIFKAIAYVSTNQAMAFTGDLKLGHYMKIPPRIMFAVQVVGTILTCFMSTAVQTWMFENVQDICQADQKDGFVCPSTNSFATASLVWGGVGPQRMFSPGAPYSALCWFFLIGALLPIPFYILARRYPLSSWRYVNIPVALGGLGSMPPASGINYASWAVVGFIFNYFIRRFHFRWWMRFNYLLSAGLDAGVAVALIIIFLCVELPKGGVSINWWGNTVWMNTADANGIPLLLPDETTGIFGPTTWS